MLNNNQEVNQTIIDDRILPTSGLITVKELMRFSEKKSWMSDKEIEVFVAKCEEHGIFVLRIHHNPQTWLVCLDDFKKASKNVTA